MMDIAKETASKSNDLMRNAMPILAGIAPDDRFDALTLDTSVFIAKHLSLESGLLKQLEQFRGSIVRIIIPYLIQQEVLVKLEKAAVVAQRNLKNALNLSLNSWCLSEDDRDNVLENIFHGDSPREIANKRLESFFIMVGVEVIGHHGYLDAHELLDRYFALEPPFEDKKDKKHEFPDAIALLTLEAWAIKNKARVLVLTLDEGWKAFCNQSSYLFAIDKVETILKWFNSYADSLCSSLAQKFLDDGLHGLREAVELKIKDYLDSSTFELDANSHYYFEGDIVEVTFNEYDFADSNSRGQFFAPINFSSENQIVQAFIIVRVDVEASFSFYIYDSIDKEYVDMGSGSEVQEKVLELEVLLTFEDIVDEPKLLNIEIVDGHNVISFGFVEPEWMCDCGEYDD